MNDQTLLVQGQIQATSASVVHANLSSSVTQPFHAGAEGGPSRAQFVGAITSAADLQMGQWGQLGGSDAAHSPTNLFVKITDVNDEIASSAAPPQSASER
jgi:hypothetical protein